MVGRSDTDVDTRARIAGAATTLFRREGYAASGLKRIATESAATYGSIYHFFPGGKAALAEDVVRAAGPDYLTYVVSVLGDDGDPLVALAGAFERAAEDLAATDWADGCPIATLALEVATTHEGLRRATSDVFDLWIDGGAAWFSRFVADDATATWLAQSMIMLLEGAFLLARAGRDGEPLRAAGQAMVALTSHAMQR